LNRDFHLEMANKEAMIKLYIDVDYAYPSRIQSFLATVLKRKIGKDYLKNSKIIAKMINETRKKVKAYWFFTLYTTPDRELLELLHADRQEVALHLTNNPYAELKHLEKATGRKINYYTVHGTERLLARLMWRGQLRGDSAQIPDGFPLKSFYDDFRNKELDWGLDRACYDCTTAQVIKMAAANIAQGVVLHLHPEWLFQQGKINQRGPIYEALKSILEVDKDLETLAARKKWFVRISSDGKEYEKDVAPTGKFLEKLADRGIDVFTFVERKWCCSITATGRSWAITEDNVALLQVATYGEWWEKIGKKTRNMVRKAEKGGVKTEVVEPSEKLAEGIWQIYNETPIRQERAFPHYGASLQSVTSGVLSAQNCTFIGAFLQGELVGFMQLIYGDKVAVIAQILSLQRHSDKAVNNALVAKAAEVCAAKQVEWVMYGRIGNHPSLDRFKESNGFVKFPLTRYYVPVTRKGRIAVKMGLHREVKDALPQAIKYRLIPFYNWVSRTKMRVKLRFGA
jgi:hypothetical protein